MSQAFIQGLEKRWYSDRLSILLWPLLPLSWLFRLIAGLRRQAISPEKLSVPVIVVGNISVGGAGKTPLTIWLVEQLKAQGVRPGVISRGYGGKSAHWPVVVTADSDPALVGDEPVLIAKRAAVPVVCAPDRIVAGRKLLEAANVDLILCDDGLQHYRLARDIEIAVVDATRGLGNRQCLPAGPLREAPRRLSEVDYRILNGQAADTVRLTASNFDAVMTLQADQAINLLSGEARPLASFASSEQVGKVDALAGIGNPQRFADTLAAFGIEVQLHALPDHAAITAEDLARCQSATVLMTEKDAVKLLASGGADERCWFVPVVAALDGDFSPRLIGHVASLRGTT